MSDFNLEKQFNVLKTGVKDVYLNGTTLTYFFGWWFYPLKSIYEIVLAIAGTIIPTAASIILFAEPILGFILGFLIALQTLCISIGKTVGVFEQSVENGNEIHESILGEMHEFYFEGLSVIKLGIAGQKSLSADVLTALLNPFKLGGWIEITFTIFKTFQRQGIIREVLSLDFLPNIIILGRTQDVFWDEEVKKNKENSTPTMTEVEDGYRFMKHSTAAYGVLTVSSVNDYLAANDEKVTIANFDGYTGTGLAKELGIKDELSRRYLVNTPSELKTRQTISQHVGIPESDIIMFVKPGGNIKILRHYIAVDRKKEEVILALRGTYSITEALIDLDVETRDFCGGKAHGGIADSTDEFWDFSGDVIKAVLDGFPEYKLVICGHSLGAGAAVLLTIKIYSEKLLKSSTNIECMAFASPAVFTPLNIAQEAISKIINFSHNNDCVPLLSGANACVELVAALDAVDKAKGSLWQQFKVIMGFGRPSDELIKAVRDSGRKQEDDVVGLEKSYIPASKIVWMRKDTKTGEYTAIHYLPEKMPEIYVNEDMVADHLPPFYEEGLSNLTDSK